MKAFSNARPAYQSLVLSGWLGFCCFLPTHHYIVTPATMGASVVSRPPFSKLHDGFIARSKDSCGGSCHANNHSEESSVAESSSESPLFTSEDLVAFEREGFLVVSGLLDDQLEDFIHAGHAFAAQAKKSNSVFSIVDMGLIFNAGKTEDLDLTNAFRSVAFDSKLPQAAAELMHLPPSENVRVLRDVFMSKSIEQDSVCDWHVDDIGFWPESYDSKQNGVNVWIAMDDMPAAFGGSMALSPGSHHADEWRFEAYESIGQDRTTDGGFTKEAIKQRVANGETLKSTCDLGKHNPEIREKIEDTIFIPDLKKGDVIFATRTLFHRTLAVTEEGKAYYKDQSLEYLNRYSIRYVPGTAKLPTGWGFEWSIVTNGENSGQSLDAVMDNDEHMWYPRAWPTIEDDLEGGLNNLAENTLDDAKSSSRTEVFELISLFMKQ